MPYQTSKNIKVCKPKDLFASEFHLRSVSVKIFFA